MYATRRARALRRALFFAALLVCAFHPAVTQSPAPAPAPDLAEFEGLYDYHDGGHLYIVAGGGRLVALIGDGKYPLREAGGDIFLNPGGDRIPFVRDAEGKIVAFREGSETFRRRSTDVPAATRALLSPRPPGPNGKPASYLYQAPPQLQDGIKVGKAGAGTLSPELAAQLVNGVVEGKYPEVRSLLVHHKGALRLEEYFYGYDRERPHPMRSLTKSVVSLLAGAAVDRGLLRADQPVLGLLGYESFANPDPRKLKVTLTDLLSHQSGFACDDHDGASPGAEVKLYEAQDWMRAFVDLPMVADPGTVGRYCSFGILAAGRAVEIAVKKPLADFAQEVLFAPLGVRRADWKWEFRLDRSQRDEFGQIYLRPRDMLKLGLLLQQRGEWQGTRVVSAAWIEQAIAKRSRVDDSDYGLGIWHRWYNVRTHAGERRVDTLMLSGNGGQKVYVVPTLDLVVVFTGGAFNQESPVNEMMAGVILPGLLEGAGPGSDLR